MQRQAQESTIQAGILKDLHPRKHHGLIPLGSIKTFNDRQIYKSMQKHLSRVEMEDINTANQFWKSFELQPPVGAHLCGIAVKQIESLV